MTVNELIAELQILVKKGHGELGVTTYDCEYDEHDFVTEIELLEGVDQGQCYSVNPLADISKQKSFISIR